MNINKVLNLKALSAKTGVPEDICMKIIMAILEEADITPIKEEE